MTHSTAVLFAQLGTWLRLPGPKDRRPFETKADTPPAARLDGERNRLPPRDESFYWAWQYWSQ